MALIDDIIEMASSDKEPIGNLLRKCLILGRQIPNEKFRAWLDNELDGYNSQDELPSYQTFRCVNKGLLVGLADPFVGYSITLSAITTRQEVRKLLATWPC